MNPISITSKRKTAKESTQASKVASVPEQADTLELEVGVSLYEAEKQLIFKTLTKTNGNRTKAAEILGISIRTLRNKLNEYKKTGETITI